MKQDDLIVVGAGLTGPVLSAYLAKRGFRVKLFERRPDPRVASYTGGRSINLALSRRGISALEEIGAWPLVRERLIPMKGRMMHALNGVTNFQPYGTEESDYICSISRSELNQKLLTFLQDYPNVEIQFSQKCEGIDFKSRALIFKDETSEKTQHYAYQHVFGADGSSSALRKALSQLPGHQSTESHEEYGYKELTIPPGPRGAFQLEKNALHIWPRKTFMLIALPNLDGSFTCTLFLPFKGPQSFATLTGPTEVEAFFNEQFADARELMGEALSPTFFSNPTGQLVTVRTDPWFYKDELLLVGDAAHAIVPFFGQGMNCSFEDCSVLNRRLENFSGDWQGVFREYDRTRRVDTHAIADLALENFVEMRDKVGDPQFLLMKGVERALHLRFPEKFVPRYTLVTFRQVPYSFAKSQGVIQDEILSDLCQGIQSPDQVDMARAEKLISRLRS